MILVPARTGSDSISQRIGGLGQRFAEFVPGQDRGQIKAKAVHMHLLDPVMQAVDDHSADDGMVGIEGIAGAADSWRRDRPCVFQDVVGPVFQAPEAQGRTLFVAFGGVVEDHVQDDLDPGPVQGLDHIPEFIQRSQGVRAGAVTAVGCEEA